MGLDEILGTFFEPLFGPLVGGATTESNTDVDHSAFRLATNEAIVSRGWRSAMSDPWPRDAEKIWIWRVTWNFPSLVDPRAPDPAMNANDLWWKPWRPSDPAPTAPLGITGDRGDER